MEQEAVGMCGWRYLNADEVDRGILRTLGEAKFELLMEAGGDAQ